MEVFFISTYKEIFPGCSNRKTRPAATGSAGIGIFERKSPVAQAILPVHLHAIQVQFMGLVHNAGDAFDLKMLIILCWMIEAQYVGHTRTAATFHADPELLCCVETFRRHQLPDRCNSACGECNGYCL